MKKILLIGTLMLSLVSFAQYLQYENLGILFYEENPLSSARAMGMKNAFGALGSDFSAVDINPAGNAVSNNSQFGFTLASESFSNTASFYQNDVQTDNSNFNLNQLGVQLVFDSEYKDSDVSKLSLGVNYGITNNYNNAWIAEGKGEPTIFYNPDSSIEYDNVDNQSFDRYTSGHQSKLSFSIAAEYVNGLYVGASLNTYNLHFLEDNERFERSNDSGENYVEIFENFWQEMDGNATSISFGFIKKINNNFRLGLAYTTPTWFRITEESNLFSEDDYDDIGYIEINYSDDEELYANNNNKVLTYDYKLRLPSKTTLSTAYIFNDKGLISADFTYKNYKNIQFDKNEFSDINGYIDELARPTYNLNIGTEWRFDKISVRGGYAYVMDPYKEAYDSDNKNGFALGFGYDLGSIKLDFAYDYTQNTSFYNQYADLSSLGLEGTELQKTDHKIAGTFTYRF